MAGARRRRRIRPAGVHAAAVVEGVPRPRIRGCGVSGTPRDEVFDQLDSGQNGPKTRPALGFVTTDGVVSWIVNGTLVALVVVWLGGIDALAKALRLAV